MLRLVYHTRACHRLVHFSQVSPPFVCFALDSLPAKLALKELRAAVLTHNGCAGYAAAAAACCSLQVLVLLVLC